VHRTLSSLQSIVQHYRQPTRLSLGPVFCKWRLHDRRCLVCVYNWKNDIVYSCNNMPRPNATLQRARLSRLDTQAKVQAYKTSYSSNVWIGAKCLGTCSAVNQISWTDDGVSANGSVSYSPNSFTPVSKWDIVLCKIVMWHELFAVNAFIVIAVATGCR
jgi:hypothetical protein